MEISSLLNRILPVYEKYIVNLENFNTNMEDVYSRIASMLPVLETQVSDETGEAQNMLDFMIKGVGGTGVIEAIKEIETGLLENSGVLDEYNKKYSTISHNVMGRLESFSKVSSTIAKMRGISNEIKLFSINSVIVSSRAGQTGLGFKSISHFIIELSEEINKTAQELGVYATQVLKSYDVIKKRFVYLFEEIYKNQLQEANKKITLNLTQGIDSIKEVYRILEDLIMRIQQPLKFIPEVMIELQKQDIAKQSIEHTVSVFKQVLTESKNSERKEIEQGDIFFTAYLLYIMDKIGGDLDRTHEMINNTNESVKKVFQKIYDNFMDIEQDQKEISGYFLDFSHSEKSQGFLKIIFDELRAAFVSYQKSLKEETRAKADLLDAFDALEKNYNTGAEHFKVFDKYYSKMNNINILAQIEMNKKTFAGHDSQAIRVKFYSMLDYLRDFKEEMNENIQKNFLALLEELKNFSEQQKDQEQFINANILLLDKNILEVRSLYEMIEESLSSVIDASKKVVDLVHESREKLVVLDQMAEEIVSLKSQIDNTMASFKQEYEEFLKENNLKIEDYEANNPFILKIERNKVNIEKHIVESGDIELF